MTVTLRQLRYLCALVQHGHFGRAADACAITQPALSMQIRDLEKTLGVALVERRPGEIVLTELGKEVARRAEDVLTASRDLVDFAQHRAGVLTGRLTLGVIPSLAPYVLPKILPPLQDCFPELRLELRETQTKFLLEELKSGVLDVVMLALPVPDADVAAIPLFEDPFLLAVPANDPRPERLRVVAEDIDQKHLILLEDGHCLRDQALAFCATARRTEDADRIALGASSLATVIELVANGFGVTLMPQVAVDAELRDERVKLLRFAKPEPGRTVGLAFRRSSPRKSDFAALGKTIQAAVGGAAESAPSRRIARPKAPVRSIQSRP